MRALLGLLLWGWSVFAQAEPRALVDALAEGVPLSASLRAQAEGSAQGLFLLGWLAESGRYGEPRDDEGAARYFQAAAEQGGLAAIKYCWQRCVTLNAAVRAVLDKAGERGEADALYLLYLDARRGLGSHQAIDRLLLRAAQSGQADAIGELYADHFLNWASGRRSVAQAARKLRRCRSEGVVYCYYLSGALHRRQGDSEQALFYFQLLRWLDRELFARHLTEADLDALIARLPQQSLEPVRSRAAVLLSTQPATSNPRIDRFRYCRDEPGLACVSQLARRDEACLPAELEATLFDGFRASPAYRICLGGRG